MCRLFQVSIGKAYAQTSMEKARFMKKLLTGIVLFTMASAVQASTTTKIHGPLQGFFPPSCLAGQTLVTHYDANGRITGYECVGMPDPTWR